MEREGDSVGGGGHPPTPAMISLLMWPFWFTEYKKAAKVQREITGQRDSERFCNAVDISFLHI